MRSLVQPKKLTFVGSNGRKFGFLCKPKDDLRRDCRLVDFNNLGSIL
jgi:serine/threonine-protein kinase ATR